MRKFLSTYSHLFKKEDNLEKNLQKNFIHLYFDQFWFGILTGSTVNFLPIFAARIGASSNEIGILNAAPAMVNLLFAIPAVGWLQKRALNRTVFYTSVFMRIFYVLFILVPFISSPSLQIAAIIIVTFLMNVPGTIMTVGLNSLFGETVPPQYRARVAGIRNAVLSLLTAAGVIASGIFLNHQAFPFNYQIVFALGLVGALMSSFHLYFLNPPAKIETVDEEIPQEIPATSQKTKFYKPWMEILRSKFGLAIFLLFMFHFVQYLPMPIFPIYTVNILKYGDSTISIAYSFFYLSTFFGSLLLERFSRRSGYKKTIGIGIILLSGYPFILAFSTTPLLYYLSMIVGGFAWALISGSLYNYLLEYIPPQKRPDYFAWYNIAFNFAILSGSLIGPMIGGVIGAFPALLLFAIFRMLAGMAVLRWG